MKRQISDISFLIFLAIIVIGIIATGCRLGLYIGIGPQQFDKVSVEIEGQEADPNIPEGLVEVRLLK